MNRQELLKLHQRLCDESRALMERKNHDYAGKETAELSVFGNLDMVERIGLVSTETGILIRMFDKLARLKTFVKDGQLLVKDEATEDCLRDLINYSVLFAAKVRERSDHAKASNP